MTHFFASAGPDSEGMLFIRGEDLKHLRQVLRMRPGEQLRISGGGGDYRCVLRDITAEAATAQVLEQVPDNELPVRITLYQGLPKGDKLELIIQKAVELGAYRIVPVAMERSVVKLDRKKEAQRLTRWNAIAKSAAEQSGRSILPEVSAVMNFSQALRDAAGSRILLPYEEAAGMDSAREAFSALSGAGDISVFIGPEGGITPGEADAAAAAGARILSLGRRILRTETAGLAVLSMCMLTLEMQEAQTGVHE